MLASLKRGAALAAVGLSVATGILASAPAASASTGDWGWPQRSGPVSHGTTDFTTFGMQCLTSAGCTASPGTTLTFSPQAGAVIVNPTRATFPFVTSDTNTQVGTCVTDQFGLQCTLSSPVSLAYGSELIGNAVGSGVSLWVPHYLEPGTTVGEWSWFDPTGMTGNNPTTDTNVAVVVGHAWPWA